MAKKTEIKEVWEIIPVESSNLKDIGFNGVDKCRINFHNGGHYEYHPFAKALWAAFKITKSHGTFFNSHIKQNSTIRATKLSK